MQIINVNKESYFFAYKLFSIQITDLLNNFKKLANQIMAFQQVIRGMVIMFLFVTGADHLRFHQVAEKPVKGEATCYLQP